MSSLSDSEFPPVTVLTAPGFEWLTRARLKELRARGIRYVVVDLEQVFAHR